MGSRICGLVVALLLGAGGAVASDKPGLADLLPLLPDAAETTHGAPVFGYVDLQAVAEAAGLRAPDSEASFAALEEAERKTWLDAMARVAAGPPDVVTYPAGIGRRQVTSLEALGVDWFGIHSTMTFWQPPGTVTVLAGGAGFPDPAAVGRALAARDFEERKVEGFDVWHRLEDNKLAVAQKDDRAEGDFLIGAIPRASRVALGDGILVHAANWPAIEAVAATEAGLDPPSPAASLSLSLLAAIEGATGGATLLQANAFMLRDVGAAEDPGGILSEFLQAPTAEAIRKAIAPAEPGPRLPLYPLAFIADMEAGADQLAVIALPYPDRDSAEAAAIVVAERLAAWTPAGGGAPLVDQIRGRVERRVVERDDVAGATFATFIASIEAGDRERQAVAAFAKTVGGAVAIVVLRSPARDEAGTPASAGAAFRSIIAAIYGRAFTPLAAP